MSPTAAEAAAAAAAVAAGTLEPAGIPARATREEPAEAAKTKR